MCITGAERFPTPKKAAPPPSKAQPTPASTPSRARPTDYLTATITDDSIHWLCEACGHSDAVPDICTSLLLKWSMDSIQKEEICAILGSKSMKSVMKLEKILQFGAKENPCGFTNGDVADALQAAGLVRVRTQFRGYVGGGYSVLL